MRLLSFLFVLLLPDIVSAQETAVWAGKSYGFLDCKCSYLPKYKLTQRKTVPPFAEAATILLLSFETEGGELDEVLLDTTQKSNQRKVLFNDTLGHRHIYELVVMNEPQKDSLFNILYNYSYPKFKPPAFASCFSPRNAILFLDPNGKQIGAITICFECHGADVLPGNLDIGVLCRNKYDMLEKFLLSCGVTYGPRDRD